MTDGPLSILRLRQKYDFDEDHFNNNYKTVNSLGS